MPAQDADQTAGPHGPVFRMVGQSEGTSRERTRRSPHASEAFAFTAATGDFNFFYFESFAGEGGQHGEGLPAQETLFNAARRCGRVQAAGCQRRRLQRSQDQQRLQQGKDGLCCE